MGTGLVLGIIVAILLGAIVFFVYGWPMLQGQTPKEGTNINVQIPNPTENQNPEQK